MTMYAIRKRYAVPAKRGGRILYLGSHGDKLPGRITGSQGYRLRIRLDGSCRPGIFHPTYNLTYL